MKKVLVTGGAGFIGSHIVDRLISDRYETIVIDNLSSGKQENLNSKAKFYQIDITDSKIKDIFEKEKPEIVFHFAGHIEARESAKDPLFDAKNNILGSLNVLENCRKFKVKKIIFASSGGEVYGDALEIPTPETYIPNPISPYGVAKLTVEKYLESYYKISGLPYVALRFGNVYGPRQNPNGEAGVIAIFTDKMLRGKMPFIHGDGKQTKDYIFVSDVVDAAVCASKKKFIGIINVGTGKETSVLKIFQEIKKITEANIEEKHIPMPAIGFERGCLSIEKIKREFNWQPKFNFNQGLEKTINWFKNAK